MRVLVASWLGSTNLGDELLFRALLADLTRLGATVIAISTDPGATERRHGVTAVRDRDLVGIRSVAATADLLVFGGGGLLQDQTSAVNLPYHLSRIALARSVRTPVVGVGLGVGPLDAAMSRALVRAAFLPRGGEPIPVTVRDEESQALLDEVGVRSSLAADLAFGLPPAPEVEVRDALAVCLRPWASTGRLPVGRSWEKGLDPEHAAAMAHQLDLVVERADVDVDFVAFQPDRDGVAHHLVADRMRHTNRVSFSLPVVEDVVDHLAGARAVLSMRYHGGVAATLGGRPSLLIGYSPKVASLARELGEGGELAGDVDTLADRAVALLVEHDHRSAAVRATAERLRARHQATLDLLATSLTP